MKNKEQILQRQNQELLERTHNERLDREAKIKAEMKEKIMGIQKGIEQSNEEIKRLRDEKQQLLEENMRLTQMISDLKIKEANRNKAKETEVMSKYLESDLEFELNK